MLSVHRIQNSIFGSNTYILNHSQYDSAWIIDPGDFDEIKSYLNELNISRCEGVLLTHTHFDHIYGLNDLIDLYPNIKIYVSNEIGRSSLIDAKKNCSKYNENPFILKDISNVVILDDLRYELFFWPNIKVMYRKVLGHSLDSVIYNISQYLFTGDSFIPNIRTVSKLKGGNLEDANKTIDFIVKEFLSSTIICPGHMEMAMLAGVDINLMKYKKYY